MTTVNRKEKTFSPENLDAIKMKMLNWASRFSIFSYLDNNNYNSGSPGYECILAAGVRNDCSLTSHVLSPEMDQQFKAEKDWIFGHICYPSTRHDKVDFSPAYFFVPEIVITLSQNELTISTLVSEPDLIWREILDCSESIQGNPHEIKVIHSSVDLPIYLQHLKSIKEHLQKGDCYELNYCQNFYAESVAVNPYVLFKNLTQVSPNPFAALYKLNDKYCICASPERFLKRIGSKLISQPIKGTIRRDIVDAERDSIAAQTLFNSKKDKSENVMIVDLVRNDLSKIAKEGSVHVEELFGIHQFPQVYHMVSTIAAEVEEGVHWSAIMDACFPMGSMTGAPKKRVMELIEKYETEPRGLFSGTIGYINPKGDFDFNVVIRSLFYNESKRFLNFKAGGGITISSDPVQEYEESLLKVSAIKSILSEEIRS